METRKCTMCHGKTVIKATVWHLQISRSLLINISIAEHWLQFLILIPNSWSFVSSFNLLSFTPLESWAKKCPLPFLEFWKSHSIFSTTPSISSGMFFIAERRSERSESFRFFLYFHEKFHIFSWDSLLEQKVTLPQKTTRVFQDKSLEKSQD